MNECRNCTRLITCADMHSDAPFVSIRVATCKAICDMIIGSSWLHKSQVSVITHLPFVALHFQIHSSKRFECIAYERLAFILMSIIGTMPHYTIPHYARLFRKKHSESHDKCCKIGYPCWQALLSVNMSLYIYSDKYIQHLNCRTTTIFHLRIE